MDPSVEQHFADNGFDPDVATGYGLAQWTSPSRKHRLEDFANATGRAIDDFQMQLDFIWFEMTGDPPTEGVAGSTEVYSYRVLITTATVEDAAVIFARLYERNALSNAYGRGEVTYETAFSARIAQAESVYLKYASSSADVPIFSECGFENTIISGDTTNIPCDPNSLREYVAEGWAQALKYNIRICVIPKADGSSGPHVNSQISSQIYFMLQDAGRAGVALSGGGYRTWDGQINVRINNCAADPDNPTYYEIYEKPAGECNPPSARPGWSNHQMGFAIDFSGINNEGEVNNAKIAPSNPHWVWLNENAFKYGLSQLRTEAWHWSIDGK